MSVNQVCEACGREWFDQDAELSDLCPRCEGRAEAAAFEPSDPVPGYGEPCGTVSAPMVRIYGRGATGDLVLESEHEYGL